MTSPGLSIKNEIETPIRWTWRPGNETSKSVMKLVQ